MKMRKDFKIGAQYRVVGGEPHSVGDIVRVVDWDPSGMSEQQAYAGKQRFDRDGNVPCFNPRFPHIKHWWVAPEHLGEEV